MIKCLPKTKTLQYLSTLVFPFYLHDSNEHIQIYLSVNFNFAEFWKIFSVGKYCWKGFLTSWIW